MTDVPSLLVDRVREGSADDLGILDDGAKPELAEDPEVTRVDDEIGNGGVT